MVRVLRNLFVGLGCVVLPFLAFVLMIGLADYAIAKPPRPDEVWNFAIAEVVVLFVGLVLLVWVILELDRWRKRR